MIIRLKANPVLLNILKSKPDIFIYGEAQISSTINLNIVGYSHYLHRSKLNNVDNFRRGLAIFFLNVHKFQLSKAYASNNFDIVWMRMDATDAVVHFCFFTPLEHIIL